MSVVNQPELNWISEARSHLGMTENVNGEPNPTLQAWLKDLGAWWSDSQTPWCGTFVAHCLKVAGVTYPKNWFRALEYEKGGTKLDKPAYGCVAVKARTGGGHVCFIVGRDKATNKLVCLGGNQSDKVCFALYSESVFDGFYWYGKTNHPASFRFTLPILTNVTATSVKES